MTISNRRCSTAANKDWQNRLPVTANNHPVPPHQWTSLKESGINPRLQGGTSHAYSPRELRGELRSTPKSLRGRRIIRRAEW